MSQKWSWLDEILRMADSTLEKPPSTITELLDLFEKVAPPDKTRGWADVTDSPRDTAPPPPPSGGETSSTDAVVFSCPACQEDVRGTVTISSTSTPNPSNRFDVTTRTKLVGVHVPAHDCTPRTDR